MYPCYDDEGNLVKFSRYYEEDGAYGDYSTLSVNEKGMTHGQIIHRIREAVDKVYEKYEGHPLIEEKDIMEGFEDIINDYYEQFSTF